MIAKQQRYDLHSELKAVPRTWAKRNYSVATSDGLDRSDDAGTPNDLHDQDGLEAVNSDPSTGCVGLHRGLRRGLLGALGEFDAHAFIH